jgi:integrase
VKLSIWKYCKINGNWRYCRPVVGTNNKIKPHWVHTNSHEEQHPEGNYYVLDAGKWIKAGPNPADALKLVKRRSALRMAIREGLVEAEPQKKPADSLQSAVDTYLEAYELTHRPRSYTAVSYALNEFNSMVGKDCLGAITRLGCLKYADQLQKDGNCGRTAFNKYMHVHSFFKSLGLSGKDIKSPVTSTKDAPKWEESLPESYEPEQIEKFFTACMANEAVIFHTFHKAGLREQELVYLAPSDIDYERGVLKVCEKPDYDFQTKTYAEREIPIPDFLLTMLREVKPVNNLMFPREDGKPNMHLLRVCKAVAKRAGMNPDEFWLHKWRSTFATTNLGGGVLITDVQYLLGHRDIASTMRYLVRTRNKELRAKVATVWG